MLKTSQSFLRKMRARPGDAADPMPSCKDFMLHWGASPLMVLWAIHLTQT